MNSLVKALNQEAVVVVNQVGFDADRVERATLVALTMLAGRYTAWVRPTEAPATLDVTINDHTGHMFTIAVPLRWSTEMICCTVSAAALRRQQQYKADDALTIETAFAWSRTPVSA
jgi:hypothetical protein